MSPVVFFQVKGCSLPGSYTEMGVRGWGWRSRRSALPPLSHCLDVSGRRDWEATRPSSWFWPLGLPHPACVCTIFALYNRPLYIIKPPSPGPAPLCLEGRQGLQSMALVFRDARASPARVRPRGPLAHDQHPSFSWVRKWRVGLPLLWCPQRKSSHRRGEGSASQPPVWSLGALLATLGIPGTLALCSPAPSFAGYKPAGRGGAALPRPHPRPHPGHSSLFALGSGRWMG